MFHLKYFVSSFPFQPSTHLHNNMKLISAMYFKTLIYFHGIIIFYENACENTLAK